ncbi:MAG: competence/damage-inducible protein A [Thermoprotei archaeon]|nr:MAG: competence/damage-inducible protein A [Thermoprotei archaeon]
MPLKVEILTIGTELIIGLIVNTNAAWLARKLTSLGCYVTRIVTVRDDIDEIVSAIHDAFNRGADMVITSGGLGPTEDDMTLEAVSKAFNRKLVLNPEALRMIEERYRRLHAEGILKTPSLLPERRKMAYVPEGSQLLPNPVGAAPGILLKVDDKIVVCLPGVPKELEAIFEQHLEKIIVKLSGAFLSKTFKVSTDCNDESLIASIIKKVNRLFPEAYIKSHATRFKKELGVPLTITLYGSGEDLESKAKKIVKLIDKELRKLDYHCLKLEKL